MLLRSTCPEKRVFAPFFMCSVIITRFKKVLTAVLGYRLTRKEHLRRGGFVNSSLFSHIPNIFAVNSHSMLDSYELKNFKLQSLLNPIHHCKAENLKFSKMHQKRLSQWKYAREFHLNWRKNYSFFPENQGTLVAIVTYWCLAFNFDVKFWNYA